MLTLEELDAARSKATQARARYIAAKTGTCEHCLKNPDGCRCSPRDGFWIKEWEPYWEAAYVRLTALASRAVLQWIKEMPLREAKPTLKAALQECIDVREAKPTLKAALQECIDVMKLSIHKPCIDTCEDMGCRWHNAVETAEELLK